MKAIPFFTDDITITAHSTSSELAHLIGKPTTLAEFQAATNAKSLALYELPNGELYAVAKHTPTAGHQPFFIEGPDAYRTRIAA